MLKLLPAKPTGIVCTISRGLTPTQALLNRRRIRPKTERQPNQRASHTASFSKQCSKRIIPLSKIQTKQSRPLASFVSARPEDRTSPPYFGGTRPLNKIQNRSYSLTRFSSTINFIFFHLFSETQKPQLNRCFLHDTIAVFATDRQTEYRFPLFDVLFRMRFGV
jgi:hypothetical protein